MALKLIWNRANALNQTIHQAEPPVKLRYKADGVVFRGYSDKTGKPTFVLTADRIARHEDGDTINVMDDDRLHLLLFNKEGKENMIVEAEQGTWVAGARQKVMRFSGNVIAKTVDGSSYLETETLRWNESQKKLQCPDPVYMRIDETEITADAMFSDQDMRVVNLVENAVLLINPIRENNPLYDEGILPKNMQDVSQKFRQREFHGAYIEYYRIDKAFICHNDIPGIVEKEMQQVRAQKLNDQEDISPFDTQLASIPDLDEQLPESSDILQELPSERQPEELFQNELEAEHPLSRIDTLRQRRRLAEERGDLGERSTPAQQEAIKTDPVEQFPPDRTFPHFSKEGWDPSTKAIMIHYSEGAQEIKSEILADRFDVDMLDKVAITTGLTRVETDKLTDDPESIKSKVGRAVARKPSTIWADHVEYLWENEEAHCEGNVEVFQGPKFVRSDIAIAYDKTGLTQLRDNVRLIQRDGDWLEEEKLIENVDDKEQRERAKDYTVIYSDEMDIYKKSSSVDARGDVKILQQKVTIFSDEAEYSEENKFIHFRGSVYFQKKDTDEWMRASQYTYNFGKQSKDRVALNVSMAGELPEKYKEFLDKDLFADEEPVERPEEPDVEFESDDDSLAGAISRTAPAAPKLEFEDED